MQNLNAFCNLYAWNIILRKTQKERNMPRWMWMSYHRCLYYCCCLVPFQCWCSSSAFYRSLLTCPHLISIFLKENKQIQSFLNEIMKKESLWWYIGSNRAYSKLYRECCIFDTNTVKSLSYLNCLLHEIN